MSGGAGAIYKGGISSDVPSGIADTIDKLNLPLPIKTQAKIVYSWLEMKSVPREPKRMKYICHCVYQAYHELGAQPPDPHQLVDMLDVKRSLGISAINNKFCYKAGIQPASPTIDPNRLLENYISNFLMLPETIIPPMLSTFKHIITVNKHLLGYPTKEIVASFIICYLENIGYEPNCYDVCSAVYIQQPERVLVHADMMNRAIALS